MKTTNKPYKWVLLVSLIFLSYSGMCQQSENDVETLYYGIEIDGVICGYNEYSKKLINENGKDWLQVNNEIIQKLTILGQNVEISISSIYKFDPETGKYFYCDRNFSNGSIKIHSTTEVKGDKAFFTSNIDDETKELDLSEGVILESPIELKHIVNDFIKGDKKEKTYKVLDDMKGEIFDKEYKFIRTEEIEFLDKIYTSTVIEELDKTAGSKKTYWLDNLSGLPLKLEFSGRTIYLTDASVKNNIEIADYNNLLFGKVDTIISNIQGLTYLNAEAIIQSEGEWITVESLNFPGQKFVGTVTENLIEGVFEIEPVHYDGTNAPGFPFDYPLPDSLQKNIEPETLIESDHPDLIAEAKDITKNATNSWDAATSLCKWVAENVKGAIPGGTSAINTYYTREGECASHSRLLVAFCRAMKIPARLSAGCMYTTYHGGSFCQHVWTEVFMGDAGWIAVDAATFEYDFVDAGHIRLGKFTTFHPKEMKIHEYRIGDETKEEDAIPEKYMDLVGKYTLIENSRVFELFFENKSLSVKLPNEMVLALNDADENGLYYPKMSRQINFRFDENISGDVSAMWLQQLVAVPKKAEQDSILENVSEKLKPFIGKYFFAQANIEINVWEDNGDLYINDPFTKSDLIIQQNSENDKWGINTTKHEISFGKDKNGEVNQLVYYQNIYLPKGELASTIIDEIIAKFGIEEGLKKYYDLKKIPCDDILFTETSINNLGHKYLTAGENSNAIEIFKLNVKEYPKSWNAYDSLGEAYMNNGEKRLARKNYKKSIRLNPENSHAKEMLTSL
ncbi:MAG: hypothetical protein JEY97_00515 [Bacteroidales bacterium]|nr:hypothetical protein [Bacteroidales bacterium]